MKMADSDKPTCCDCNEKIADNSVTCDGICKLQFHLTCASIKKGEFNSICANKNIKWFCDKCCASTNEVNTTSASSETLDIPKSCFSLITAQNKVIQNLTTEISNIKMHVNNIDDSLINLNTIQAAKAKVKDVINRSSDTEQLNSKLPSVNMSNNANIKNTSTKTQAKETYSSKLRSNSIASDIIPTMTHISAPQVNNIDKNKLNISEINKQGETHNKEARDNLARPRNNIDEGYTKVEKRIRNNNRTKFFQLVQELI